ncbi:MAG: DeoR/GlpR transcriptional regulator [Spirochaetales bacterium]|nr:DeoR/GlpR transcriptional regulator [Spirochaetales bacterium]
MTKQEDRIQRVMTILRQEGSAAVQDLARRIGVSHMTIRRDLTVLEAKGTVRLFYGSVALEKKGTDGEPLYRLDKAEEENRELKERIADYCAKMIRDGDVLYFDAGTTTEMIVSRLPSDVHITVVCSSINTLNMVAPMKNVRVIITGGVYHETSGVFESAEGIDLLKKTRTNLAFISAGGIRADLGVTCSNLFEVPLKQVALESSLKSVLVADSSKFGRINSVFFAEASDFDIIVTDNELPEEIEQEFTERDIHITRVS